MYYQSIVENTREALTYTQRINDFSDEGVSVSLNGKFLLMNKLQLKKTSLNTRP